MNAVAPYRPFGAFRFLLAALVVAQHVLANCTPPWVAAASEPYEVGSVAVLVFFTLSGFVIYEAADAIYIGRPGAFFANRLLRIAPHFLAALAATVVLTASLSHWQPVRVSRDVILDPDLAFSAKNLAANALGFLPFTNLAMREDLLPVAWAVRIEMIFYLVILAILSLNGTRLLRSPGFGPVAAIAAAAILPLFLLAMLHGAPAFLQLSPYFVLGGALYLAQGRRSERACGVALAALTCAAWEFASRPSHHPVVGFERAATAQALLLTGLLVAFAILSGLRAGRAARLDRSLGDLSYPLYIWHGLPVLAGLALGAEAAAGYAAALAVLALATAILAHRLIDPGIDRIRDLIRGRRLRAVANGTAAPA